MLTRWRRVALAAVLVASVGCSESRREQAPPDPSPSGTRDVTAATGTPSTSSSARAAVTPTATPSATTATAATFSLVFQRDQAVYALPLTGKTPRATKLLDVRGRVQIDRGGRYLAVHEARKVVIVELRTRRVVASVAGGEAAAFAVDDTALVTVRPTPPANEHDCHRPTRLVSVDLRTGTQRTVRELDDQFVPEAVVGDAVVGSVTIDEECETPAAAVLDVASGRLRRLTKGASILQSVSPEDDRIWIHRYPDAAHPRGSHLVVDGGGREIARLAYSGEAVFGPGELVAYTQDVYGKAGTEDYYFPQDVKLRVGRGLPSKDDRSVSVPFQNGDLVWGAAGDTFVARVETPDDPKTEFQAVACTVRLTCRRLDLRWYDEVTLLGVVPATSVG